MIKIPFSKNSYTNDIYFTIDKEDYDLISQYDWRVKDNGCGNFYVVDKRNTYLHRLIMQVFDKNIHIDHINGNGLDNRKQNLRKCTNAENRRNSKINKRNTSGFKGVRTRSNIHKFQAYIYHAKKFHHLGYYDTAEIAAKIYDKAALKYFGEFARLNFSFGEEIDDPRE